MFAQAANSAEYEERLPAEDPHAAALRAFRDAGPWPLPELVPWSIDEAEHAALLALSRIESPEELALKLLEESLPIAVAWEGAVPAPAQMLLLALRDYCRAELTVLCCDDDHDLSANAACRLFRYEERLHDAQLRRRPQLSQRPRPHPAGIPHLLRRARGWLALARSARTPHALFRLLAREGDLFDRLSPRAAHGARVLCVSASWALIRCLHELTHAGCGKRRLRLAGALYRLLIPGTRFFRNLIVEVAVPPVVRAEHVHSEISNRLAVLPARVACDGAPRAPPG